VQDIAMSTMLTLSKPLSMALFTIHKWILHPPMPPVNSAEQANNSFLLLASRQTMAFVRHARHVSLALFTFATLALYTTLCSWTKRYTPRVGTWSLASYHPHTRSPKTNLLLDEATSNEQISKHKTTEAPDASPRTHNNHGRTSLAHGRQAGLEGL